MRSNTNPTFSTGAGRRRILGLGGGERRVGSTMRFRDWPVVETKYLFKGIVWRRFVSHVFAPESTLQGRQGAPLLEHCREQALRRRQGGAAPGALSRRNQRQPAGRLAPGDRGLRRGGATNNPIGPISRRPAAARSRRGPWGADPAWGHAAASAAAMGRVLARLPALRATGTRPLLGGSSARFARRNLLEPHP